MNLLMRQVDHRQAQPDEQHLLEAGPNVNAPMQAGDQVRNRHVDEARGANASA